MMISLKNVQNLYSYLQEKPLITWPSPDTILLLKVDRFEGILNRIKIYGMVNDHSSSYNL